MLNNLNSFIPNIRDLFTYGEAKNFAFDNCLAFLMEKLGEGQKLDYWIITGITGNGYTPVYNKNDATTACEYCVSGYLAGPDYIDYIFDTIGYGYTYVTAEQINTDKPRYVQMLKNYIGRGMPVVAINNSTTPDFDIGALTHYIYVERSDYMKALLFGKDTNAALYNRLNAMEFIPQDWIFAGEKKRDISLVDICRNAVMKIPHWLTLPERNGVFFGAPAYRAWADDIEAGRYDSEIDAWHNYGVYLCNLATIAWANNVNDAPYATIINRLAQIEPQYADMNARIGELFFRLGEEAVTKGVNSGIWKGLEDLGGGLNNYSRDAFRGKERCAKIAAKFREAADCMDEIVRIIRESLPGCSL